MGNEAAEQQGIGIDLDLVFQMIGEREVRTRMMAMDIARLENEKKELQEQLANKG